MSTLTNCCVQLTDTRAGIFGGASWRTKPPTNVTIGVPPDEQKTISFGAGFQKSGNCEGSNTDAQTAIWTAKMKICREGLLLRIRGKGKTERADPWFDFAAVWIDDKMVFFAASTDTGGGCAMEDKIACRVISATGCPNPPPPPPQPCEGFDYDLCEAIDDDSLPACCGSVSTTSSSETCDNPPCPAPDPCAVPGRNGAGLYSFDGRLCDAEILAPGDHTLKVVIGTGDGLYHVGAYWDVFITFSCTGKITSCPPNTDDGDPCDSPYPPPPDPDDGDGWGEGEHPGYPAPPPGGAPQPGPGAPLAPSNRGYCPCDCLLRRANVKFWGFLDSSCTFPDGSSTIFQHSAANKTFSCPLVPPPPDSRFLLIIADPTNNDERGLNVEYDVPGPDSLVLYANDLIRVEINATCGVCPDPDIPAVPGSVWTGTVTLLTARYFRSRPTIDDPWSDWAYADEGGFSGIDGDYLYDISEETCYPDGCDGYFHVLGEAIGLVGPPCSTAFYQPVRGLVQIKGLNLHCAQP